MIVIENNELNVLKLDTRNTLSNDEINYYDYILMKNNLETVIRIMNTNIIVHQDHKDILKYDVDEYLNFNVYYDHNLCKFNDNEVYSLSRSSYDLGYEPCVLLLDKFYNAWNYLNEIEKYILKSLEFDDDIKTDEDLEEILLLSKNKYYIYKKSAFIKMGLYLKLNDINLRYEKEIPNLQERFEFISNNFEN